MIKKLIILIIILNHYIVYDLFYMIICGDNSRIIVKNWQNQLW